MLHWFVMVFAFYVQFVIFCLFSLSRSPNIPSWPTEGEVKDHIVRKAAVAFDDGTHAEGPKASETGILND